MHPTPPYTKVKTIRSTPEGEVIDSHSTYKDHLSSVKQEISRTYDTSRDSLAADLIKHSEIMRNGETEELDLKISCDKVTGEPRLITVTWLVHREHYGR